MALTRAALACGTADIHALLLLAAEREASDVHLVPGHPAVLRVHGQLVPLADPHAAPLGASQVRSMIEAIVPPRLAAALQPPAADAPEAVAPGARKNLDFSISLNRAGRPCRFRANAYLAQGEWCVCLRHVPEEIPSFEWMGFPRGLAERLVAYTNGLVIITGVTGSGKSTTLAALVNLLNERGGVRVITVEEPVEYVHGRISTSVITQREVGRDVDSFYDGLKYGLRQDPNVILVGEIRDRETAQMALSAAETGHLILTTLHTKDAKGAVTRFVDLFPYEAQEDVRTQLALSLRSVVSQHLLPSAAPGEKRVLATEVMHVNQPVRIGIKFGKIESLDSAIQTGVRDGLLTLDDDLQRLLTAGRISLETARRFAKDADGIRAPG
ncbi:MAG: PilT/PilU family type 4a pilus ATPase [Planctomycetes bacterium]|nr:PilT/PilU family type 4a pilus ATPase [Planctomycetota bacterium]